MWLEIPVTILAIAACLLVWWLLPRSALASGLILIGIGFGSLVMSYGIYGSEAWLERFGRVEQFNGALVGPWIEALRITLLAMIGIRVLNGIFGQTFRKITSIDWEPYWVLARLFLVGVGAVTTAALINYHLGAPYTLEAETNGVVSSDGGERWWWEFKRPYIWYFPYSAFNFLALAVPFFVVPIVAGVVNVKSCSRKADEACKGIATASSDHERREILSDFEKICHLKASRFIEVPAWMLIVLLFELLVGSETLTGIAKGIAYFSILLIVLTGAFVIMASTYYQQVYQEAVRALNGPPDPEPDVMRFIRNLFIKTVPGVLIWFLVAADVVGLMIRH